MRFVIIYIIRNNSQIQVFRQMALNIILYGSNQLPGLIAVIFIGDPK